MYMQNGPRKPQWNPTNLKSVWLLSTCHAIKFLICFFPIRLRLIGRVDRGLNKDSKIWKKNFFLSIHDTQNGKLVTKIICFWTGSNSQGKQSGLRTPMKTVNEQNLFVISENLPKFYFSLISLKIVGQLD